jgi:murein DD-endopeptidase MepM/ murein hydrolase activator NlpD
MTLEFKSLKNQISQHNVASKKMMVSYKPNFVLVNSVRADLFKKTEEFLNDIIPFNSNKDSEKDYNLNISTISTIYSIVCSLFWLLFLFLSTTINIILYSFYRLILFTLEYTSNLPHKLGLSIVKSKKYLQTILFADTRDLWYLNLKLDFRTYLHNSLETLNSAYYVLKKSYLLFIVLVSLSILSIGSNSIATSQSKSFLSNFIKNNSQSSARLNTVANQSKFNLLNINASAASVQIITEYEIKKGDSIDKIAVFYGVNKETLIINNNITGNITPGQKIFIPWVDGYIYKTPVDNTPEELSTLFSIDRDVIYNENIAIYSTEINKFKKDTLVLLPTKDYNQVAKALENIKNKAESERNQQEEEQKRKSILEAQAVSSKSITNSDEYVAGQKSNFGFIWPTRGTISRCYASYHKACDIANFSSPPIVASASGTVIATYYFDVVGYGLAVVVDHGNGVKTLYAHMREISVVKGQQVSQGQQLGIMGQTGQATGIHLHFEVVINGVQSDPLQYLP